MLEFFVGAAVGAAAMYYRVELQAKLRELYAKLKERIAR